MEDAEVGSSNGFENRSDVKHRQSFDAAIFLHFMIPFKNYIVKETIAVGESDDWPVVDIPVEHFYYKGLEDGIDEKAVQKYMKQLQSGQYEPVSVSHRYSTRDVLDGSHRIVAAHRLGMKTIKAHVEPGTKI